MSGVLEFSDDAGNVLANLEKKTTCKDSIVTVEFFIRNEDIEEKDKIFKLI